MRKKFCDKCNKPMKTDEGRIFYWDSISALAVIVGKFHIRSAQINSDIQSVLSQLIAECVTSEDLELIAHYRTSAPKLARICEMMFEIMEFYAERANWKKYCFPCKDYHVRSTDEGANARSVLKEIERILDE